ncbi:FliM/FliN family flagellar motor C-terminal domain-containing protein [Alkaliphilus oremlandii]|uniref:FliM/FliN family flagellar motor C-terminal domain-containing protein n=1 Tax=Alkaliphilus oremlandii TaxID=461876 RepID=UPI002FE5AFB5
MLEKRLTNSSVPINVEIGHTYITVKDFLELQIGDVIALDANPNRELEIKVGEKKKYFGAPGTVKNKLAVKITRVDEKGDELYE